MRTPPPIFFKIWRAFPPCHPMVDSRPFSPKMLKCFRYLIVMGNYLVVANSALNFPIYFLCCTRFRQESAQIVTCGKIHYSRNETVASMVMLIGNISERIAITNMDKSDDRTPTYTTCVLNENSSGADLIRLWIKLNIDLSSIIRIKVTDELASRVWAISKLNTKIRNIKSLEKLPAWYHPKLIFLTLSHAITEF